MLAEDYKPPIASSRPETWPVHRALVPEGSPYFSHNFTIFSRSPAKKKISKRLLCEIWGIFPAVFWPGGSEPDLWGEWLLLWRPIRSPVRWATVAKANLRQGGWNEGKRGDVANTKYMLKYIHIHTGGILFCINLYTSYTLVGSVNLLRQIQVQAPRQAPLLRILKGFTIRGHVCKDAEVDLFYPVNMVMIAFESLVKLFLESASRTNQNARVFFCHKFPNPWCPDYSTFVCSSRYRCAD